MKRKDFIRLVGTTGVGAPMLVNGTMAVASNVLSNLGLMAPLCSDVNNRVLIIVRLAGANDGLNTTVPISQYANYVNRRPNISLANTGPNAIINLDSSLTTNKLTGLHPSLASFKSLYDSGKLTLINGVGYPSPNRSHFKSENTMFAGKDGNTNNITNDGMFGRYLAKVYPNQAGNPSNLMPDPLALHFGDSNPSLMFGHSHEVGLEYNMFRLQGMLFPQLAPLSAFNLPVNSEHYDLLAYLTQVEQSADAYYQRIINTFNAGANSSAIYPNTDLARQLRTVARLLHGGIKTKVFQVTIGGFDNHANQVVNGSTHTGIHANLLSTVANSLNAFQKDVENLGLADRVLTVSFSEFGRTVDQNGSLGTDHGDLSPFFVIGKHVNPGVLGNHPIIPAIGRHYSETERKYDYRQIYATIMQDWLGADNSVMQEAELNIFSTTLQKVPIVKSNENASPSCLMDSVIFCGNNSISTKTAVKVLDSGGWSYYAEASNTSGPFLFAIQHNPGGAGANTNNFTASIQLSELLCTTGGFRVFERSSIATGEGILVSGYYFTINVLTGTLNGNVNLRLFHKNVALSQLQAASDNFHTSSGSNYKSPVLWGLTPSGQPIIMPSDLREDGLGLKKQITPIKDITLGFFQGVDFLQFNAISNINGRSGFAYQRVTKINQNMPLIIPPVGSIRFNTDSSRFEGFNGTGWVKLKKL